MTPQEAREVFRYETGKLYWRIKPANHVDPGDEAGAPNRGEDRTKRSRWHIGYRRKLYPRARLVWMIHHGEIPVGKVVDHINNDCTDDRAENLQLLSQRQNVTKEVKPRDLPTGVRRKGNRFTVYARIDGKYRYISSHATAEEASAAYQRAITLAQAES